MALSRPFIARGRELSCGLVRERAARERRPMTPRPRGTIMRLSPFLSRFIIAPRFALPFVRGGWRGRAARVCRRTRSGAPGGRALRAGARARCRCEGRIVRWEREELAEAKRFEGLIYGSRVAWGFQPRCALLEARCRSAMRDAHGPAVKGAVDFVRVRFVSFVRLVDSFARDRWAVCHARPARLNYTCERGNRDALVRKRALFCLASSNCGRERHVTSA